MFAISTRPSRLGLEFKAKLCNGDNLYKQVCRVTSCDYAMKQCLSLYT